jgi:hypothetical protein
MFLLKQKISAFLGYSKLTARKFETTKGSYLQHPQHDSFEFETVDTRLALGLSGTVRQNAPLEAGIRGAFFCGS